LVATSSDETLTVARTHGLPSGKYVKLQFEQDWRITLQRQGRKPTGLMYFSRSTGPRDTEEPDRGSEGSGGSAGEGGSSGTGSVGGTAGGTGGSETSECGTITLEGQCDGNAVTWCESNELRTLSCTQGKTCGWNAQKSYYDCIADSVPSCGSVTAEGTCDGSTVTWCDSGQLRTFDCATQAQTCVWNDTKAYYDCVAPPATGCGAISVTGACTGTLLQWCDQGQLQTLDCATTNQVCDWSDTYQFFDCI
jgi:hypothetical protein